MKKITIIIIILICQISFSQITQQDIDNLKGLPENYQLTLDVLEQKLVDDNFETTKHNRFVVDVFNNELEYQKTYDTINNNYPNNEKIEYRKYVNNLQLSYTDFDDKILKIVELDYDNKHQLEFETFNDENEETFKKISHYYEKCKPNYIADLLEDSSTENPDETFKCETITSVKLISKYIYSTINIKKIGFGKIKEISLNGDKDSEISSFKTFIRDEEGKVIQIDFNDTKKTKVYKTFAYNKQGDLIKIKQGYTELYYSYKYDTNNNWIEKLETSKVKNKRRVFKRTFTY